MQEETRGHSSTSSSSSSSSSGSSSSASVPTLFTSFEDDVLLCVSAALCMVSLLSASAIQWRLSRPRRSGALRLSEADRAIEAAPVKREGLSMHFQVPAERWCVTREDLKQFRRLVKNAIAEGRIAPTERDPFDPKDDVIGPCIHTVNAKFIKPVTAAAGGLSWALMKHPEGLPCDLFVTHGWAEGVFEFIDKVLNSWPGSWTQPVRHAYCCMLSNPQNLNISEMCATPEESPFAKALANASHVLVVPNQRSSIYTRVWCAYEAFMGYSRDKQMRTAVSPGRDIWLKTLQVWFFVLLGHGAGVALAVGLRLAGRGGIDSVKALSWIGFVPLAMMFLAWKTYQGSVRLAVVRCALPMCGGGYLASVAASVPLNQPGTLFTFAALSGAHCCIALATDADLVMAALSVQEQDELLNGFTGRLRDAKCSVAADGERIRRALSESGSEAAVDEAVQVLISMGTFSPRLREAVDKAGLLGNVSRFSYSILGVGFAFWSFVPLEHLTYHYCKNSWLAWIGWGSLTCWVLTLAFLPHDCVAFAVASLLALTPNMVIYAVDNALGTIKDGKCLSEWGLVCFSGPIILLLTLLGPARAAKVPLVGPVLVRLLLTCSHRRQATKKLADCSL